MADIETLGILDEIQALVSDKLQVVRLRFISRLKLKTILLSLAFVAVLYK